MRHPLKVAVADDERDMRDYLQELLPRLGHQVVGTAKNGKELVELCRAAKPDLIITDIRMPDTDGVAASTAINRERQTPVILVSAYEDSELLAKANSDHVMAYLVKPVREPDLRMTISLAMMRFEQFQTLLRETSELKLALEERKTIERAKGVVTRRLRMEEPDAFRRLQKLASTRNQKLIDVARMILSSEEVFQALEKVP